MSKCQHVLALSCEWKRCISKRKVLLCTAWNACFGNHMACCFGVQYQCTSMFSMLAETLDVVENVLKRSVSLVHLDPVLETKLPSHQRTRDLPDYDITSLVIYCSCVFQNTVWS